MAFKTRLCDICESRPAVLKCPSCGRWVCEEDFDYSKNLCVVCASTLCEICGLRPSIGYCRVCGRVGCEECLIQESTVSYVCRECAERLGLRLNSKRYRFRLK
ncbi:hypothetical protein TCELL_0732 [Thermogladius calderae 1633]|uniref:B box-type domain-containing protein n=1 Tax=Thermogladius calderae (strain DSM 22663 / VKM B-2946 / 1633) TaxID=1184251 RepID=I3TEG8_THEC1|nr:hypothetical protein TCELL_0732 [Thermogladius calderae 1633]